jgi:hypothetical protein
MQVVMLMWTDGKLKLPIAIEVYQEDGPSKIKIAKRMLKKAQGWGIVPKYVLFDSWYAAEDLLNYIDKLGWKYITRVKSNRKFNGQTLSSTWSHRYGRKIGKLKQVGHRVVIQPIFEQAAAFLKGRVRSVTLLADRGFRDYD